MNVPKNYAVLGIEISLNRFVIAQVCDPDQSGQAATVV